MMGLFLTQPCLSNPEVLKRIAANLQKELIKTYGGQPITYRIYNDDHTFWCECSNCKKLDDPKAGKLGKNSNRYWTLINYLAKELLPKNPQLTLLAIAYQDYRDVPTKVKPDPRVPVQIAPHGDCYNHTLDDPKCPTNPRYRKMFEDWKKTGAKLYVFEYHNQLPGECRHLIGNDSGQLAGNMMGNITQIIEGFKGATGVDPMSVLSGMLGAKIADNK